MKPTPLLSLALTAVLCTGALAQQGETTPKYRLAKANDAPAAQKMFDEKKGDLPAYYREHAEFVRELIGDFVAGKEMTQSEAELAKTVLDAIGFVSGDPIASRSILDDVATGKSTKTTITTAKDKPTFSTKATKLPRKRSMAWVVLSMQGRSRKIIEVPGIPGLDAAKRARMIAARMARAADADPHWWMQTRVGAKSGETVVKLAGSPNHLVTADRPFARLVGESPAGLAEHIIHQIKLTMDSRITGGLLGSRAAVAEEPSPRERAVALRQEGDELCEADPKGAEAKYRASIAADSGYGTAYARLIDLLTDQKRTAEANKVREMAKAAKMSDEDRDALMGDV